MICPNKKKRGARAGSPSFSLSLCAAGIAKLQSEETTPPRLIAAGALFWHTEPCLPFSPRFL